MEDRESFSLLACDGPLDFQHHCRRCGGIFCGSCTQQRMVLRGQGDSPVRICEACKKLEEASRFEMRYGHKNRAAKGVSKHASKKDDEILNEILGNEDKAISKQNSSASSSNIQEVATQAEGGDVARSLSLDQPTDMLTEAGSATPEELRQHAIVEKQKYRTLKAEGKPEEALKAFKRGKELERQAAALEISIRKNRKRALSSTNIDDTRHSKDEPKASSLKDKLPSKKGKETDDLSAELKELGWSELDLRDAEKKPATLSLEGELSSLIREVSQKPNKEKPAASTDRSQVLAHKKKALELKKAGNLVEAKEELKRAKILERKIEEEELLGESDESDDELSSLMRSVGSDDDPSGGYKPTLDFDVNRLISMGDDIAIDGNFEVTDADMDDPEIASALKSFGWEEEDDTAEFESFDDQAASSKRESYVTEIQSLKREALNQKRAGNTAEALSLLKKAKLLEAELDNSDTHESAITKKDTVMESAASVNDVGPKSAPKSKLVIQRELIALKKKALSLRREGKIDESDEELRKAKVLEEQLEDMNKAPSVKQPSVSNKQTYDIHATLVDGDKEEVTDQDLHDPAYLSLLKNLGWEDDDKPEAPSTSKENKISENNSISDSSIAQPVVSVEAGRSRKSKGEIQRELLALKRKALTLRRQGEAEEAEEVLKMARSLEEQLHELEEPSQRKESPENNKEDASLAQRKDSPENNKEHASLTQRKDSPDNKENASFDALPNTKSPLQVVSHGTEDQERHAKDTIRVLEKPDKIANESEKPQPHSSSLQQEILAHKRKALAFKRDGKLAEAKEELRQAKLLEKQREEMPQSTTNSSDATSSDVSSVDKEASPSSVSKPKHIDKEESPSSVSKPLSSRERFKLQQESLGHKRQALKLRREGRTAEADAEFELAKLIEARFQEPDPSDSAGSSEPSDDVGVEDFLDPQLLAALQSIGLDNGVTKSKGVERPEPTRVNADADLEKEQLVERIKAEKVKAVNLKRSGKQAEALDALRRAKLYEKKLQSLT